MRSYFSYFLIVILLFSCKTIYQTQSVVYTDYRINNKDVDSSIIKLLQPYADSVNKSMNDVVAVSVMELEKKQPEGTLGNMMIDAMFTKAKQIYNMPIDAAFINNGGLRLPSIPAGKITRGKIFELAPFDNTIVVQKISGKILQQFLNHISTKGGWPTAGCSWQIKDLPAGQAGKNAVNVLLNGLPVDEMAVYNIAMIDYVANGGDDCSMLKNIPQINKGFLLRDAILEYLADFTKQGKTVSSKIEKRVTNAE